MRRGATLFAPFQKITNLNLVMVARVRGLSSLGRLAAHARWSSNCSRGDEKSKTLLHCSSGSFHCQVRRLTTTGGGGKGKHTRFQGARLEENTYTTKRHETTTGKLEFIEPSQVAPVPAYRVLESDGSLSGQLDASLSEEKIIELYEGMLRLNVMDKIMFDSQRQGRISFYMTNFGEEAAQFGSAAALSPRDWVFAQYREAGVLLHRQMSMRLMLAQCYGNREDLGKGRQMPIHYGNRALNFVTISSPLTTQLPQAAGTAYSFKLEQQQQQQQQEEADHGERRVVMCYFGEGAASEGDAHAAMNMAATLSCPVLFFCRNNGYAISTPASEQFVSDGIVQRALGYGMAAVRVDGNDLFAVYEATRQARELAAKDNKPCLIEAMTYRVGHHSTSDDSSAYRSMDEVRQWERESSPLARVHNYLLSRQLWTEERQKVALAAARAEVIEALNWAEKIKKLPVSSMFDDVYDTLPANLRRQRDELKAHLAKYGEHYSLNEYESV